MINPIWFLGEVVNIADDPELLGRVRVRVYSQQDSVTESEELIWSHIMLPTTSESTVGVGQTPALQIGSRVIGFYADGSNKRVSVITGTMLTNPEPDTSSREHSLSFTARGTNDVEKTNIGFEEPDSSFAAQYPFNRVTRTKAGHVIEIDDTPGEERIHVFHKVGTYVEINKEGRIIISTPSDSLEIVGKDKVVEVKGDARVLVEGNLDASIGGNTAISTAGNLYLGAGGDVEISAAGSMTLSSALGLGIRGPGGVVAQGSISALGALSSAIGATSTFTSPSGKIIQVSKGIITSAE